MAFVRKVRTGSGATAVQVAQKRHGKLEITKHVGSGHTPVEVALLVQRGREILRGEQEALDLGVDAGVDTGLARAAERQPALLPDSTPPATTSAAGGQGVHVVGTSSDVLWSTLRAAYGRLGFGILDDEVLEQVVLARLFEPTSKLDTIRVLEGLGVRPPHHTTIYRRLRRAQDQQYRDQIAEKCFEHASTSGGISLVLYDDTTLYFEAEYEDQLRKVGYSKERRVNQQIVVGLLVDRNGFPLEIGCFESNHAETRTIVPIGRGG